MGFGWLVDYLLCWMVRVGSLVGACCACGALAQRGCTGAFNSHSGCRVVIHLWLVG